jgi:predicted transcriptional regulator
MILDPHDTRIAYRKLMMLRKPMAVFIIKLLQSGESFSVTEIIKHVSMNKNSSVDQSQVSFFLAQMRMFNIVMGTKKGKYIYYRINHSEITRIRRIIKILSRMLNLKRIAV